MKRIFLLRFSIILSVAFVNIGWANSVSAQNTLDSNEYSVYTSFLQRKFVGKGTKELVIKKQTAVDGFPADMLLTNLTESLPSLTKDTIGDFIFRNKKSAELTDKFNLKVKTNLVDQEINRIFYEGCQPNSKENCWEVFNKKYPTANAIITLSRVGFNKDKSQALIFVAYICGWTCGEGSYILIVKKDNNWEIDKKLVAWIS